MSKATVIWLVVGAVAIVAIVGVVAYQRMKLEAAAAAAAYDPKNSSDPLVRTLGALAPFASLVPLLAA